MFIYYWDTNGVLQATLTREEQDHYFLFDDGVLLKKELLNEDGKHFSTWNKAKYFRDMEDVNANK